MGLKQKQILHRQQSPLHCFDAVGWATEIAAGSRDVG